MSGAAAGRWRLERVDGKAVPADDADEETLVVYRDGRNRRRYAEPCTRLSNPFDLCDLLAHLGRKSSVSNEVLGQLARFLDAVFDLRTVSPRRVQGFDAITRIREIAKRRKRSA